MPTLRKPNLIAVAISDLHLSLLQPACRADKDWMQVQAGYLEQVKDVADGLPIICAGDIFDRWNAPPELINFALEHLPTGMLCVPGQHDLPHHRIDSMHRSGYGVLVLAKKIVDLSNSEWFASTSNMVVYGYGWNQKIVPPSYDATTHKSIHIAVLHRYVWTQGCSYPGAPQTNHVAALGKELKGYDVAICGDNHMDFLCNAGLDCILLNAGGFIRRKSDEIDRMPCMGLIYSDGSVKRCTLDISGDRFHEDAAQRKEVPFDMAAFIEGLEGLGEHGLDFRQAVENHIKSNEVLPATAEIILEALGNK